MRIKTSFKRKEMNFIKFITLISLLTITTTEAKLFDGVKLGDMEKIKGVTLHNALVDDTRIFHAEVTKNIKIPMTDLASIIITFENRCNNKHIDKRIFSSNKAKCRFHNNNLVETLPIRKIKNNFIKLKGETDRFLLHRHVYNRKESFYYDLVIVQKLKEKNKKEQIVVTYTMIPTEEVAKYIDSPKESDSYFNAVEGSYILTKLQDNLIKLTMTYASKTDHWMLNSSFAVGTIYGKIAEGTSSTMKIFESVSTSIQLKNQ